MILYDFYEKGLKSGPCDKNFLRFPEGVQQKGNPTMTTSTITAGRKGDPQHYVEEKNKWRECFGIHLGRSGYVCVVFAQHNVEGLLFSWPWPCLSSLLDFLFLNPLGKTVAIVFVFCSCFLAENPFLSPLVGILFGFFSYKSKKVIKNICSGMSKGSFLKHA